MNRTGLFLVIAGALAVLALVVGLPRTSSDSVAPPAQVVSTPAPVVATPPSANGSGSLLLSTRLSHPFVGPGTSTVFLTADITGVLLPESTRAPVNIALVIDRSGSMAGFKIAQAKQAAATLVSQLTPRDRLSVVHYGSDVKSLNGLQVTAENRARLLKYIEGIFDDGGTNLSEGLAAGRAALLSAATDFKVNRLVLISDGQPTEGITESAGLGGVVRAIRAQGISLSSIGVGADFNEVLMESIADLGGGAYAYVSDASQLSTIFQRDLSAASTQVARGVSLTIRVPRGAHFEGALGHRIASRSTVGGDDVVTVAMPDFAAAQVERIVFQLGVNGETDGQTLEVGSVVLAYTDVLANQPVTTQNTLRAQVSSAPEVVLKKRDIDAVVFAARARAGANTQRAVDALQRGDRSSAEALMRENTGLFEEAKGAAGETAVTDDLRENEALIEGLKGAREEEQINSFSKDARNKARVNYGLIGSTY